MKAVRLFVLSVVLVVATLPTSAAKVPLYDSLFVFGDSLVDNGNDLIATQFGIGVPVQDPAIPPSKSPHRTYYKGRFANGPIAVEYLWQLLTRNPPGSNYGLKPYLELGEFPASLNGASAVSFGFGGSGTGFLDQTPGGFEVPGLSYQVLLYAQASPPPLLYAQASPPPPSNRPLFVVVTGANDYLKPTPLTPNVVVGNIVQAIDVLHQLGARNVMVLNLPDLGTIPLVAGLSAEQRAGLSFLSAAHNIALESVLQAWGSSHPDVNLIPIDVNVVLQGLPASMNRTVPALDALVPPTGPYPTSFCLFLGPETCPNVPTFDVELQYLYWDAEHPTTAVHRLLGQHLYDTLTQ